VHFETVGLQTTRINHVQRAHTCTHIYINIHIYAYRLRMKIAYTKMVF